MLRSERWWLVCAFSMLQACGRDVAAPSSSARSTLSDVHQTMGSANVFPSFIPLPSGFRPEGIAIAPGGRFFVSGIWGGAIYQGDLRTGAGGLLVPPAMNHFAVGLAFDRRSGFLFVAGGPLGTARVYNTTSGAELTEILLNTSGQPGLVNDVVITPAGAYFTDSFRPVLYFLPLDSHGVPVPGAVQEIPLGGDFQMSPGFPLGVSTNGIEATPDGRYLIIVNTDLGTLYRVDAETGIATLIDIGNDSVIFGDGLLLRGFDLYVVQNLTNSIAVIRLSPDLVTGTRVNTITDSRFRIPSTIAGFGSTLYAVNARFDLAPSNLPVVPVLDYEVVGLPF